MSAPECRCRIIGETRDPYEPHIPGRAEWEQADDCPVHPLPGPSVHLMSVDLSAAAAMVVAAEDVGTAEGRAALSVWASLTGLEDYDALDYAQTLAADPDTTVTATVAPF